MQKHDSEISNMSQSPIPSGSFRVVEDESTKTEVQPGYTKEDIAELHHKAFLYCKNVLHLSDEEANEWADDEYLSFTSEEPENDNQK